jgi:glutamate racemase
VQRDIKLLVVACNTASAVALEALLRQLEVPIVGVIEPGARRAAEITKSGVIGVIGTEGTIASNAYRRALLALNPDFSVHSKPCPLFVPLAEEGWEDHPVTEQIAHEYLDGWAGEEMDTLILGCTHYPVLTSAIQKVVGDSMTLVDSASAIATTVADQLSRSGQLVTGSDSGPQHEFFVTDVPERFQKVGQTFLSAPIGRASQVDIDAGRW